MGSGGGEDSLLLAPVEGQPMVGVQRLRISEASPLLRHRRVCWLVVSIVLLISPIIAGVIDLPGLSPLSRYVAIHVGSVRIWIGHARRNLAGIW